MTLLTFEVRGKTREDKIAVMFPPNNLAIITILYIETDKEEKDLLVALK